jgi:hypothetical protein
MLSSLSSTGHSIRSVEPVARLIPSRQALAHRRIDVKTVSAMSDRCRNFDNMSTHEHPLLFQFASFHLAAAV